MVRLTTIALIERKPTISRSLFSRYWRDVHGVMAARIPGFETYTQYHVTPLGTTGAVRTEPFEGIAIVTFADAKDRAGLAGSDIAQYIQRDEQNVFRRALLYNLEADASVTRRASGSEAHRPSPAWLYDTRADSGAAAFLLVPASARVETESIVAALDTGALLELHTHDLVSGDPTAWNKTDVDDGGAGRRFASVIHGRWSNLAAAMAAIKNATAVSRGQVPSYLVDDIYVMVEDARVTPLGLRGWDALQTINEAGATNQLEQAVMDAIYRLPKGQARI